MRRPPDLAPRLCSNAGSEEDRDAIEEGGRGFRGGGTPGGLFIDDRPAPQRQVSVLSHLISERGGARIYIGGSEKGALATTVVDKTAPTFPPRL
jgi:hypothetical protein